MYLLPKFDYNLVILAFCFTMSLFHQPALCDRNKNNLINNLIVEFNPCVSILDRYDQNRYNIMDMVPMVAKVAEKFDRVLIDLTADLKNGVTFPINFSTSLLLSPLAVATYNKHRKGIQSKVEVWLVQSKWVVGEDPLYISRNLKFIADAANNIHEETVTAILIASANQTVLDYIRNEQSYKSCTFKNTYKWGVMKEAFLCGVLEGKFPKELTHLKTDILLFDFGEDNLQPNLLIGCKYHNGNDLATTNAFWFRYADTNANGVISMSRLTAKWSALEKFASQNNVTIVMSKAFDTWCEFEQPRSQSPAHVQLNTAGWWRLRESPHYSSTADYFFEAKEEVAEKFDKQANSINATIVETSDQNMNREYVGIFFSFTLSGSRDQLVKINPDKSLVAQKITNKIISRFSKIVTPLEGSPMLEQELEFISKNFLEKMEHIVIVMPGVGLTNERISYLSGLKRRSRFKRNPMFVLSFEQKSYQSINAEPQIIKQSEEFKSSKISYMFSISYCGKFSSLGKREKKEFLGMLSESSRIFFSFEEDEQTVKLGVERMFEQRAVTFGQCEKFLTMIERERTTIGELQFGFVMLHYYRPDNIYGNVMALYNFLAYWQKLREWATMTKTTVILNSALDRERYTSPGYFPYLELGWWRHQLTYDGQNIDGWIDKKTDIMQHEDYASRLLTPEENGKSLQSEEFSNNYVIIITVTISIVVVVALGATFYCGFRRHYRQKLSNEEVHDFLHGNQNSKESEYRLPYDKSRFEIEPKSFSVDESRVLGSGEFGMVCAGNVKNSDGVFVDVAVKMVNSNKFHRSTLTGLLSEIKVLAHVGKHDHITELVGAFTADLKRGKIYVFLELGKLGSLEKYLRNLHPEPITGVESGQKQEGIGMVYMESSEETVLDLSLSQDFYRWSREICNGMSYLASKNVIHADLATRNVLLNAEKAAKICDFGLARRMYNYTNYVKRRQEPLPWKWLPPESLTRMDFSEKSDVWAYGVTIWEIYSLGDTPYPGFSWDPNFPRMLQQGFRMSKPQHDDKNMYSIMMKCWNSNPSGRPPFSELLCLFENDGNE